MTETDVIVIGAGIIGAACAWQLAKRGQRVTLVDDGNAGATAAGMGHLVCMDDDPAELTLARRSPDLCKALVPEGKTVSWTYDELGLERGQPVRVLNPISL